MAQTQPQLAGSESKVSQSLTVLKLPHVLTFTDSPSPPQKQCFTKGLIDRLKARSSIVRPAGQASKLPVFIWESPPLGKLYRVSLVLSPPQPPLIFFGSL